MAVEVVWFVVALAVMGGMAYLGTRIEPHHVSRDGKRILCVAQLLAHDGQPVGRWRETKLHVLDNGKLAVEQRRFLRRRGSLWRVLAEAETPPKRRAVFLLRYDDSSIGTDMLAVKMPTSSRAVGILRGLVPAR